MTLVSSWWWRLTVLGTARWAVGCGRCPGSCRGRRTPSWYNKVEKGSLAMECPPEVIKHLVG